MGPWTFSRISGTLDCYGPEDDAWYNIKDLGNAKELVEEFERQICEEEEAMLP